MSMKLRRRLARLAAIPVLLVSCAAIIAAASPAASAAPLAATSAQDGWVRIAHLSPQAPAMDIYLYPFGDSAPGGPQFFREVTVASDGGRTGAATLAAALAMVNAQESPYQPAHSAIVRPGSDQAALTIEFASPSPLGLLSMVLTADVQPDQR